MITPGCRVGWLPRTCTRSPVWNARFLAWKSCPAFCCSWLSDTLRAASGCSWSKCVLKRLSIRSSAGGKPYGMKTGIGPHEIQSYPVSSSSPPGLLSARSLEAGWYGDVRMCQTPFFLMNSLNSPLVKTEPLCHLQIQRMQNIVSIHKGQRYGQ